MKILWIEDQPELKIDQFASFLRSRNIEIPMDSSIDAKLELLKSVGIDTIQDFSFFIKNLIEKNWKEQLTTFFNEYNLVFCDVNLTDNPIKYPDDKTYEKITENTNIHFERHYEGQGIFESLLVLKSETETQKIANKFYFFSAYDGLPNVKKRMKQLYCEKFRELEWAQIHCIENRSDDSPNEFNPYNFQNESYARHLKRKDDWIRNERGGYNMEDCADLYNIFAEKEADGKWCIKFSNKGTNICLHEGEDFTVEHSSIITTQERIIKAINGIVLGIVEALYNKYYKIQFLKFEKTILDRIFEHYYQLNANENYSLNISMFDGLFTDLRNLFELSRTAIQNIVFPNNSFEECMRQKEFAFWSNVKETKAEVTIDSPYPENVINNLSKNPPNGEKWIKIHEKWIKFHEKWTKNKDKKWLPIFVSCPGYINSTIRWAFNDLLSAYTSHEQQAKYEREYLGEELMPSKIHEFKVLVEALLLVLDFIIKIDGNTQILKKMHQFIPFNI